MAYTKPYIVPLSDALSVIQSNPLTKGCPPSVDLNPGYPQKLTINAYEGDE